MKNGGPRRLLKDYCNLVEIKPEDLRVLELIRGVKLGMCMKFLEGGTEPRPDQNLMRMKMK